MNWILIITLWVWYPLGEAPTQQNPIEISGFRTESHCMAAMVSALPMLAGRSVSNVKMRCEELSELEAQ